VYSTVDSGLTITSTGSGVRPDEGNADESVVSLLFNAAIRRSGFVKYSPVKLLIQASSPLCVVQIWPRCDFEHIPFFAFNRFSHCRQRKRRLITWILSGVKTLTTESVDVDDVYILLNTHARD